MTVSTVPLRSKNLSTEERHERLNRVNVSVVEYGDEMKSQDLNSPGELGEFLANLSVEEEHPEGRLIVVQDLSTCMIGKLGAAFNIEPYFFRGHIGDYVWLNIRDPQAEILDLEAFSQSFSVHIIPLLHLAWCSVLPVIPDTSIGLINSANLQPRMDHLPTWSIRNMHFCTNRPPVKQNHCLLGTYFIEAKCAAEIYLLNSNCALLNHMPPSAATRANTEAHLPGALPNEIVLSVSEWWPTFSYEGVNYRNPTCVEDSRGGASGCWQHFGCEYQKGPWNNF